MTDLPISPVPPVAARPPRRPSWLLIILVFAAVFAAYHAIWHAGFIWDDDSHVTTNAAVAGTKGLGWIWTSPAANYFPLTTSTFWLIHALWGFNPLAYHLVDVLFHATDAMLLWFVLRRLRVRGAWLGAMLWALHPVQVESAAWVSETVNTQSAFFYLLAIWVFLQWVGAESPQDHAGGSGWYAAAWAGTVLAILSKASTVMLPVVLGLCWWWLKGRWRWRYLLWLAPFFAISGAAAAWTIWEQQFHSGAIGLAWDQTHLQRLIISGKDVWFYLGKLLWPHPLIFVYPRWAPDASRLLSYVPALAAVGVILGLWWQRRRMRPVFFAALYFGVSLFPVMGFFNVYYYRYSFVADHFQYLASMGALALLGAGLVAMGDWIRDRHRWLAVAPGPLLLVAFGMLTWSQSQHFVSMGKLWRATLAANPGCWMAHNNFGGLLVKEGQYKPAIRHLEESLRLHPGIQEAEYNLGLALFKTGHPAEAIPHYEEALRLKPHDPDILARIGDALSKLGRLRDAAARYEASLQIDPNQPLAQNNLGVALIQTGRAAEAIPHFEAALRLKPGYAEAQNNLGNALARMGRFDEAVRYLEAVAREEPDFAGAHFNLAMVLLATGRTQEAVGQLRQAVRLDPRDADAQFNLGGALLSLGHPREAIPCFEAALRLNPGFDAARAGLQAARQQLGP